MCECVKGVNSPGALAQMSHMSAERHVASSLYLTAHRALSALLFAEKLPFLLRNPPGILEACDDEISEPSANWH